MVTSNDQAAQACAACKKRKGKCDRALPSCGFCQSKSSSCHYLPSGIDFYPNFDTADFPAAYFLDHGVFQGSLLDLKPAGLQVPSYVLAELGDIATRRMITSQYFSDIHQWFPIVSKQRFLDNFFNPFTIPRADVVLLCLSMKLVASPPATSFDTPYTNTYFAASQMLHSVEISRTLTLTTLQAAVNLAIYEIGHAMYPAAHMSVGMCANYAIAIGLGWQSRFGGDAKLSWLEKEERRRVWWAIVILERYLALGWPERSCTTEGPSADDLLPCDDTAWDNGEIVSNSAMTTSAAGDINMGKFARLAQATHLLDSVLHHVQDSTLSVQDFISKTNQLDRALHALAKFTVEELTRRNMKICCQTALIYSALAILYAEDLASKPEHLVNYAPFAQATMYECAMEFALVAEKILLHDGLAPVISSPFMFHWGYTSLVYLTKHYQKISPSQTSQTLKTIQAAMELANTRWRSAGAYLDVLSTRQVMLVI